jgi:hypothetical protein
VSRFYVGCICVVVGDIDGCLTRWGFVGRVGEIVGPARSSKPGWHWSLHIPGPDGEKVNVRECELLPIDTGNPDAVETEEAVEA